MRPSLYSLNDTPTIGNRAKYIQFNLTERRLLNPILRHESLLSDLAQRIEKRKGISEQLEPMCSVLVEILRLCPSACTNGIKVLHLLQEATGRQDDYALMERIRRRLIEVAHSDYLQIWLQHLTYRSDLKSGLLPYTQPLCRLAGGEPIILWDRAILKGKYAKLDLEQTLVAKDRVQESSLSEIELDIFGTVTYSWCIVQ